MSKIIVADDDRDSVDTLVELLRLEGHEARGFDNGSDVLHEVQSVGADAILLDIGMPSPNGYAVAQQLRERYGSARPVLIAVTARSTSFDKELAAAYGFDHHITKPYRTEDLVRIVNQLVGARGIEPLTPPV